MDMLAKADFFPRRSMIPIESAGTQRLVRFKRRGDARYTTTDLGEVRFVPLIGEQAWP